MAVAFFAPGELPKLMAGTPDDPRRNNSVVTVLWLISSPGVFQYTPRVYVYTLNHVILRGRPRARSTESDGSLGVSGRTAK